MSAVGERAPLGALLRDWRQRRRMSQLDLALEAGVSARHLSFLETGRSKPSREMVLHLAEELDVPLRERNRLLLAAGYAPAFDERPLEDPELEPVRRAVAQVLTGIEPFPAAVIDRWWNLVASNRQIGLFLEGVAPHLLEPPANVLRVSLHPEGMAPRIANLAEWRAHLLSRLRREIATTGDARLQQLLDEVSGYPAPPNASPDVPPHGAIAVPLRIATPTGELTFISTVATFGTAVDVTVAELSIEAFFPADPTTAQALTDLYPGGN
jgi:transcriptional regulator with XRE-family HTH domain